MAMLTAGVMVVGATGGVGQAVARLLMAEGYDVVATCRTRTQQRKLVKDGLCRRALIMKLDDADSIVAAFTRLRKDGVTMLAGWVNCAAITQPRPLELLAMDDLRGTFEINLFGPVQALQQALPLLREAGGRIVMVSSTSGSVGVPLLGAYSASKFALEAMADVLRRELAGWDIKVSLVIPAGIKTSMIERQLAEIDRELQHLAPGIEADYEKQYRQHRAVIGLADKTAVTPEQVAADVLRALTDKKPAARYLCGVTSKVTRTARRMLPDAVLDRLFDYDLTQHKN